MGKCGGFDSDIIAGMRWAFFGPFMTMHLAGGASGMAGAFQKFGGRDSTSDDRARRVPLNPAERQIFIDGVGLEAGGRSVAELEAHRDALLLELCRIKSALGERAA